MGVYRLPKVLFGRNDYRLATKKKQKEQVRKGKTSAFIAGAGNVIDQPITQTLEKNYMPYAMSVIVSRALPEIDGFKPSHRKLLYTMYKMGLLGSGRTKSANIVGQTMRLNPHGDGPIYETMVRMSRGNETLLHSYVDSKGNFGRSYSRDMAYAASRYTEAKLDKICNEFFRDIDKDTVDMIPNYDNSTTEPTLLPTTFPSILVNSNIGIAVSMASNICSFNLKEVCATTIELMKNPDHNISSTLLGPDFCGGGFILQDKAQLKTIINTGRGTFKIRCKWQYDKDNNCIEITQIPPTTTIEAIMDKIVDNVKQGKIKDITDMRDETDLNGLKLTIDLKRGVDPDRLMQRLFRMSSLQDNFSCNFNILIAGYPKVMGVKEILEEWVAFRVECVKRRVSFDLTKRREKLHLLQGLQKVLLDIDKAIKIVRETDEESEVVTNLMIGFGIDVIQAEYVAEIKLRHLNKEYILRRIEEIDGLVKDISDMEKILKDKKRVYAIIEGELQKVIKDYAQPRKTMFLYDHEDDVQLEQEETPDYPVNLFFTKDGYFKKITPLSLRMGGEQKLKDTDSIVLHEQTTNTASLLFFTNKAQVYKAKACDFEDTKASVLGEYIPAKLGFDADEMIVSLIVTKNFSGYVLFFFDNGKVAKVPLLSYETKTNRKKLANAYCDKFVLAKVCSYLGEQVVENSDEQGDTEEIAPLIKVQKQEFVMISSDGRRLLFDPEKINEKATRDSQGVAVMTLKKGKVLADVNEYKEGVFDNATRYRSKNLPAAGMQLTEKDYGTQITFDTQQ